jgi:tellurite resistance protein TerC
MAEAHWWVLGGVVTALLALDLFIHRGGRAVSKRAALVWTAVWIGAGLTFNVYVWIVLGSQAAERYLAAYLIEKTLSADNLFVFYIIFRGLSIPAEHQHKALSWGILGALIFRAVFVFAGVTALERWSWLTWGFAAVLLWAAYRAFRDDPSRPKESTAARWLGRHLPVADEPGSGKFLVRNGHVRATPLLLAVVAIELTDIAFAFDSVPAALSVTRDRFLVYASNAFAVLGLRALYLVLAETLGSLRYLHYGIAIVLVFAALKMVAHRWIEIPPLLSAAMIVGVIGASSWLSVRARSDDGLPHEDPHASR